MATAAQGQTYHLGTLNRMGPGFMPTALGVILTLIGLALLIQTFFRRVEPAPMPGHSPSAEHPISTATQWRGWLCICAGVLAFALLAEHTGLIPATFACVLITAMGDVENRWWEAIVLAVGMVIASVGIFWWGLGVLLPLVKWDFF
ncbi:tripartite tricarboxylate transporter TctB family protein [Acetobacteraceae bacterium H6797]|nr:tripartite tricarboxylate transporter TctB family protein [Acetobacteraceae bacterium H6797]